MRDIRNFQIKNYSIFFLTLIIVSFFILPIAFTKKFALENTVDEQTTQVKEPEIDYSVKYKNITLLHTSTGEVEELSLDDYLVNVVSAEMPVDYEEEALKAQATVARTYTLYQLENSKKHQEADICDSSSCCQAWITKEKRYEAWKENQDEKWEKIRKAVYSTAGDIITYQGKPIDAFFHSNSGGTTEIPVNVWGGSNFPYLQVVETNGEDEYSQFYSEKEYTYSEIEEKMQQNYKDFQVNWEEENAISILEYTESSRIRTLKVGNKNISGVEARKIFELRSTNFTVNNAEGKIKFSVVGYGHGVGMSQTGSNTLAKQGKTYKEIIGHFYKDIEIKNIK